MKTMTCKQLGGACDEEFHTETFGEMAKMSRQHGTEMFKKGDKPHLKAMEKMKELMRDPKAIKKWMEEREREFNALPDE